jgi:beta-glucanase (GH16 family)
VKSSTASKATRSSRRLVSSLRSVRLTALCLALAAAVTISACGSSATPVAKPVAQPLGSTSGQWKLKFSAHFAGDSLNRSQWSPCYPQFHPCTHGTNYGNNELEWYLPQQDKIVDNQLQIVAQEIHTQGKTAQGSETKFPWRSGIVTTHSSFQFRYGFIQVTAKVPKGAGYWPALWLLVAKRSWPPEIDMLEVYGNHPSVALFTNIPKNLPKVQKRYHTVDLSAAFHTYGLNWSPQAITWYLDGRAVFRVTTGIPRKTMYFLANLAVSSKPGLHPDAATPSTGTFAIKSVDIWQN